MCGRVVACAQVSTCPRMNLRVWDGLHACIRVYACAHIWHVCKRVKQMHARLSVWVHVRHTCGACARVCVSTREHVHVQDMPPCARMDNSDRLNRECLNDAQNAYMSSRAQITTSMPRPTPHTLPRLFPKGNAWGASIFRCVCVGAPP